MNKQNLNNEKLDQIGRSLLEATKAQSENIEKIAAAPQLFNLVKARIEAEQSQRKKEFLGNSASISFWNWQKVSLAFAVLIIFGVIAIVSIKQLNSSVVEIGRASLPNNQTQMVSFPIPQTLKSNEQLSKDTELEKPVKSQVFTHLNQSNIQQIAFKRDVIKLQNAGQQTRIVKKPIKTQENTESVFYSLMIGGIPNEMRENMRIIRVDMPRSSLYALGVNISPENGNETIKTDLLVGMDGRPQAFRFVN